MKLCKESILIFMARLCINRKQLAELAGVSRQTISSAINGRECNPALVGKIAVALKVDVMEILKQKKE